MKVISSRIVGNSRGHALGLGPLWGVISSITVGNSRGHALGLGPLWLWPYGP
jgi:hypothetical protein